MLSSVFRKPVSSVIRSNLRNIHHWVVNESRSAGVGEFSGEYDQFRILIARMRRGSQDGSLPGAGTMLFEGAPISVFDSNKTGIIATASPRGMRLYMENSQSNIFENDPNQPYVTPLTAAWMYFKSLEKVDAFHHNETAIKKETIDALEFVPMVIDQQATDDMERQLERSNVMRSTTDGTICQYDAKSGKIYVDGSEIELPRNIISITNMRNDSKMREAAERSYYEDVNIYAKMFCAAMTREGEVINGRTAKDEAEEGLQTFCYPEKSEVLAMFREDLLARINELMQGVKISTAAKLSDGENRGQTNSIPS